MSRELVCDLHNHSACSYDSSNRFSHYKSCFDRGLFDVLAITDHNTVRARKFFANADFQVIIGEEIDTGQGELVGLFLDEHIKPDRSILDTAAEIRAQGGLVYLQHPYYRWLRNPIHPEAVDALLHRNLVDVVEVANGGPLMSACNERAMALAEHWGLPKGAGSDAHHPTDIGRCRARIIVDDDSAVVTQAELVAGLLNAEIDTTRVRSSAATLSARFGYS